LLLGEVEPDAVVEPSHLVERDGGLFAGPDRPLPEQQVRYLVAARVDEQRVDLPDVAIGGVHVVAAALLHLSGRDDVDRFLFRDPGDRAALQGGPAGPAPARGKQLDRVGVAGHELRQGLLGGVQALELRLGAAKFELAWCCVDQVERNKPGKPTPALRLDHDMGRGAGGGIDDHALYLAAVTIATDSVTSEHERYHWLASSSPGR
jgi:hypothetical protein